MSPEAAAPIQSLPPVSEAHSFLIKTPEQNQDPALALVALRDYIDDLGPGTATFTAGDALEDADQTYHILKREMFWMVGSWESPLTHNVRRWVNPNYDDKIRYTDVQTKCECGALMTRVKELYHDSPHDSDNEHTPSCTKQNRLRARAELCDARAYALKTGLKHGQTGRSMAGRLGLSDSIGEAAKDLGVDVAGLKEDFRTRRRNTILHLLKRHPTTTVGRVYGLSAGRVREIVAAETPYASADFTAYRRAD